MLCDEITSSLDNKTTQYVENNLLNLKNITLIYITHKLKEDQLKKFDDILVLDFLEHIHVILIAFLEHQSTRTILLNSF